MKNHHKSLPETLEGLQKSKIGFSRKYSKNHWNSIGKTMFCEPVKTHAKSIRGVAKNEHFLQKVPKKAVESITLCAKIASGITFPKYLVMLIVSYVFWIAKMTKKVYEKHYTVCKSHIVNHFPEILCNPCRFLGVLGARNT